MAEKLKDLIVQFFEGEGVEVFEKYNKRYKKSDKYTLISLGPPGRGYKYHIYSGACSVADNSSRGKLFLDTYESGIYIGQRYWCHRTGTGTRFAYHDELFIIENVTKTRALKGKEVCGICKGVLRSNNVRKMGVWREQKFYLLHIEWRAWDKTQTFYFLSKEKRGEFRMKASEFLKSAEARKFVCMTYSEAYQVGNVDINPEEYYPIDDRIKSKEPTRRKYAKKKKPIPKLTPEPEPKPRERIFKRFSPMERIEKKREWTEIVYPSGYGPEGVHPDSFDSPFDDPDYNWSPNIRERRLNDIPFSRRMWPSDMDFDD